jgi:hypothetical protein
MATRPRLLFTLPILAQGQLYQLVQTGCFQLIPGPGSIRSVLADFLPVDSITGKPVPGARSLEQSFHVHHAGPLKVGSLWDSSTGALTEFSHKAISSHCSFRFGKQILHTTSLHKIFPNFKESDVLPEIKQFLTSTLLEQRQAMTLCIIEQGENLPIVLVPCFELLRCFLFWTGPKLIDRFFDPPPQPRDALCGLLTAPTKANQWKAEVVLIGKGYTQAQSIMLAAMACDESLANTFTRARAKLIKSWIDSADQNQGHKAYAQLEFHLSNQREVEVKANGIKFCYEGKQYFWVCSIFSWEPFFSFKELRYLTSIDNRAGELGHEITEGTIVPTINRPRIHPISQSTAILDSNQAGHSLAEEIDKSWDVGDEFSLPPATQDPKIWNKVATNVKYFHLQQEVGVLSGRGGGNKPNVGRDSLVGGTTKKESERAAALDFELYFQRLQVLFKELGLTVTALHLNSGLEAKTMGFSSYPGVPDSKIGVLRLVLDDYYFFYFFEALSGQRSALIFAKDLEELELRANAINSILSALHTTQGSWAGFLKKDRYIISTAIKAPLIIHQRNHPREGKQVILNTPSNDEQQTSNHEIVATPEHTTVYRCIQDMRKAVRDRQTKPK